MHVCIYKHILYVGCTGGGIMPENTHHSCYVGDNTSTWKKGHASYMVPIDDIRMFLPTTC